MKRGIEREGGGGNAEGGGTDGWRRAKVRANHAEPETYM